MQRLRWEWHHGLLCLSPTQRLIQRLWRGPAASTNGDLIRTRFGKATPNCKRVGLEFGPRARIPNIISDCRISRPLSISMRLKQNDLWEQKRAALIPQGLSSRGGVVALVETFHPTNLW